MKTTLNTRIQNSLNKGIHLTPKMGSSTEKLIFNCNHFTALACRFNTLQAVTWLHQGDCI